MDGDISWVDPGSLGLTGPELVLHNWLVGRADGRCCGNGCFTTSAEFARRYARAYGTRAGRVIGSARSLADLGQQFIDWLISPEGQKAIADYKINGEQLFYPNANDPNA